MKSASKIAVLALAVLGACASSRPEEPWRLELRTSGGFTGDGNGTYAVDSTGKVTVHHPRRKPCSFDLTSDELHRMATLLGRARPWKWEESYLGEHTCCDRILYAFTVEEAGEITETKWIDAPPPMPDDLVALGEAMYHGETSIRARSEDRCR